MSALFLALLSCPASGAERAGLVSAEPIWTSGSSTSGGDGNARWIDANRDGLPDLVTSAPNPRRWVVFLNKAGRLAEQPGWGSNETTDCDHISVLDFDRDGQSDLAATHESHCTLYLHEHLARDGSYRDANSQSSKNPSKTIESIGFGATPNWETGVYIDANQIDFGDFDGDGDLDMLMAAGLPFYGLALFENIDGALAKTPTRRVGIREYSETAIFADFDSDGDLDILAAFSKQGTVYLYRNEAGKFDEGRLLYSDRLDTWCQRLYCLDIDADGVKEVLCAKGPWGPPAASVILAQRDHMEPLTAIWKSAPDTGFHAFDFGDIDGDGDIDLVAGDWAGRRVLVYLQASGQLSSTPACVSPTTGPTHEVMFGDVDGDGDLDIAAGCLDQAMVFENLLIDSKHKETR